MAQAIPCAICQEVPEADYMVSLRPEGLLGMGPGTLGICAMCMVQFSTDRMTEFIERAQAAQEATEGPPPVPEQAEVLPDSQPPPAERWEYPDPTTEAGSWAESEPKPTSRAARKRKSEQPPENGSGANLETEATHVDG